MNTGGLAQMTFNNMNGANYHSGNALGAPGSGFASRGKGAHIKRLSVAPAQQMNSINENDVDNTPSLRTSRSHLLAGLRTAPRTPGSVPASAPYNQTQHSFGFDTSKFARSDGRSMHEMPQTAATATFPGLGMPANVRQNSGFQQQQNTGYGNYSDQILAPPAMSFGQDDNEAMDPELYAELMTRNMYLIQRQQQLQEQLRNVTAAAQQFQNINLNGRSQQYPATPSTPMSFYGQQAQNGLQPVVQPVPNQPGLYSVYNPMTGQHSFVMDPAFQQGQLPASPPNSTPGYGNGSPDQETSGYFRRGDNMSPQSALAAGRNRAFTPPNPKQSPSPQNIEPLPAPSANAYRPGHRKGMSVGLSRESNASNNVGGAKTAGLPATPMTGTFGPGLGRAGEHPARQPRGPPSMEELKAAPTAKCEGSKNFVLRQRRRAVVNLVRAGNERRSGRSVSREGATSGSDGETHSDSAKSDKDMRRSWRTSVAM